MQIVVSLLCVATVVSAVQIHHIEKRSEKCILPPYPKNGYYEDTRDPSAKPGNETDSASLNVSCDQGYNMTGNNMVTCTQGAWSTSMPQCDRFCKLDNNPSLDYYCLDSVDSEDDRACNAFEPSSTIVKPECKIPNYYSDVNPLPSMRCINGSWNYNAVCTPECGRVTPEGVPLIINGSPAYRGELPWHAGIYRKTVNPYMQICGGSLVSDKVVISAAHCFWNDVWKKLPASNYAVALGKLYRPWNNPKDKDAVKSDVKDIKVPKRFQGSATNFQDDIALVILKTTIVSRTYIRPVCLDFNFNFEKVELQPNDYLGKVAGWGLTSANGVASPRLLVVKLPYVNIDQCLAITPLNFREYITSDKICAGYTNGTALCQGDSGGGLAFPDTDRYYLWGIVSTAPNNGNLCNAFSVTTFTQIIKHERFIKKNMPSSDKCILPPYPKHGKYWASNALYATPGQSFKSVLLNYTCDQGYKLVGDNFNFCQEGRWLNSIPECIRDTTRFCKLAKHPSVHYNCLVTGDIEGRRTCGTSEPSGTVVIPECNIPNYYSSTPLSFMRCIDGKWNYIAICIPECGRVTPQGNALISNGTTALRGDLPWHAGIYSKTTNPYMQICGGSLVSNTVVISGAICFWSSGTGVLPASNYAVALGKIYRPWNAEGDPDAQKSEIKEIKVPLRFQGAEAHFQDDIAIVILETAIVYRTYIRPVCISFDLTLERLQLQSGKVGKISGWGVTSANGRPSQTLQVVDLPYVDVPDCIQKSPIGFRPYITSDKICAGYTNGTAMCRGDSGGGLAFPELERGTYRFYLRGILSSAPNSEDVCNVNAIATFTQITSQEHFIKQYIV